MSQGTDAGASINADQIEYWNQVGGPKWVRYQAMLDRQLDDIGVVAMDAAAVATGDRVLDVGCGCGSTSLAAGRRVGSGGRVLGVDISQTMLELAERRARGEGLAHVEFAVADAQTHRFDARFDVVYSRFGVMFFADPVAAFANLASAMAPGGRLAFVCWQAMPLNPWMAVPVMQMLKHVTLDPPAPDAPGPFAFADAAKVERILGAAGFRSVALDAREVELSVGGGEDLDATVEFVMEVGPVGRALAGRDPSLREAIWRDVRGALADYATPDGVRMKGAVWVVTAGAPC